MFLQLRIRGGGIFYVYFLISYILNNLACKQIFGIFLVTDIEPSRFFIHIFEEIWTGWRTSLKVWLPEKNTFWFFCAKNNSKKVKGESILIDHIRKLATMAHLFWRKEKIYWAQKVTFLRYYGILSQDMFALMFVCISLSVSFHSCNSVFSVKDSTWSSALLTVEIVLTHEMHQRSKM